MITIESWMSKPVVTVKADDTAHTAVSRMVKKNIGDVVVVDDKKRPCGIVTERDIIRRMVFKNDNPKKLKVKDIMTKNIKSVNASATFLDISRIMKKGGFRRVPIIKNGKLVGIVTARDLVKFMSI